MAVMHAVVSIAFLMLQPCVEFLRKNLKEFVPSVDGNLTFSLVNILDCFFKSFIPKEVHDKKRSPVFVCHTHLLPCRVKPLPPRRPSQWEGSLSHGSSLHWCGVSEGHVMETQDRSLIGSFETRCSRRR